MHIICFSKESQYMIMLLKYTWQYNWNPFHYVKSDIILGNNINAPSSYVKKSNLRLSNILYLYICPHLHMAC